MPNKLKVIGLLRLEIENIRQRAFRNSVFCLGAGKNASFEACELCDLLKYVPPEYSGQGCPCAHIPLDAEGRTLDWLARNTNREDCEQVVLAWMQATVERLEKELAAERATRKTD